MEFSKFQKKRLLFLLQLLNKSKTIKATKTKSKDSTLLIDIAIKKLEKLHFLLSCRCFFGKPVVVKGAALLVITPHNTGPPELQNCHAPPLMISLPYLGSAPSLSCNFDSSLGLLVPLRSLKGGASLCQNTSVCSTSY